MVRELRLPDQVFQTLDQLVSLSKYNRAEPLEVIHLVDEVDEVLGHPDLLFRGGGYAIGRSSRVLVLKVKGKEPILLTGVKRGPLAHHEEGNVPRIHRVVPLEVAIPEAGDQTWAKTHKRKTKIFELSHQFLICLANCFELKNCLADSGNEVRATCPIAPTERIVQRVLS